MLRTAGLILVVDDEFLVQNFIQTALEDVGYSVLIADDAAEACRVLDAEYERLAALVTDINLGAGDSGWEVARCARRLTPTLPVVYVTGDSAFEWATQGVADSRILTKPFAGGEVTRAVRDLIHQPAA